MSLETLECLRSCWGMKQSQHFVWKKFQLKTASKPLQQVRWWHVFCVCVFVGFFFKYYHCGFEIRASGHCPCSASSQPSHSLWILPGSLGWGWWPSPFRNVCAYKKALGFCCNFEICHHWALSVLPFLPHHRDAILHQFCNPSCSGLSYIYSKVEAFSLSYFH